MEILITIYEFFSTSRCTGKLCLAAVIYHLLLAHLIVKFQCTVNITCVCMPKKKNIPAPSLNVVRKYLHFTAVH